LRPRIFCDLSFDLLANVAVALNILLAAGVAYLVVGTYGFNIARQSGHARAAIYFVVQILIAATLIKLRGSAGELSLILLPLAGQSALLLSCYGWARSAF